MRELEFFKKIFSDHKELNSHDVELRNLIPKYHDTVLHSDVVYIKMDDITYGIEMPSVIDFKMGRITYDPEASEEKISRQLKKYPPAERTGYSGVFQKKA
jgi:hypothetical protein